MQPEVSETPQDAVMGHVYEVHKWAIDGDVDGKPVEYDHARLRPYLCCDSHWTDAAWAGFSRNHGEPPSGYVTGKDCILSSIDANPRFTESGYWNPRYAHAVSTVLIKHIGDSIQHGFVDDGLLQNDELIQVLDFWSVVCSYHFQEDDPYELN